MPQQVRGHTRQTPSGPRHVRPHTRSGNTARKIGPNLTHAGKLGKRAMSRWRSGFKEKALLWGALAAGEVVAWGSLNLSYFILTLAGALLIGVGALLVK